MNEASQLLLPNCFTCFYYKESIEKNILFNEGGSLRISNLNRVGDVLGLDGTK